SGLGAAQRHLAGKRTHLLEPRVGGAERVESGCDVVECRDALHPRYRLPLCSPGPTDSNPSLAATTGTSEATDSSIADDQATTWADLPLRAEPERRTASRPRLFGAAQPVHGE